MHSSVRQHDQKFRTRFTHDLEMVIAFSTLSLITVGVKRYSVLGIGVKNKLGMGYPDF